MTSPWDHRRAAEVFMTSPLYRAAPDAGEALIRASTLVHHAPGEHLIRQDAEDRDVYFLLRGEVDIRVHGRLVGVRTALQHVGEMTALNPRARRSADVIAREEVYALRTPVDALNRIGADHPTLWRTFAEELAQRLERRGEMLKRAPGSALLGLPIWMAVRPILGGDGVEHLLHGDAAALRGALTRALTTARPDERPAVEQAIHDLERVAGDGGGFERIIHRNDLLPVGFAAGMARALRSVAHLDISGAEGGAGTGWLLTPRLLVTAHHVLGEQRSAAAACSLVAERRLRIDAQFAYHSRPRRGGARRVIAVAAGSEELDYAVLRLDREGPAPPLRIAPLPLALPSSAPLNIIQHPQGGPKMLGIRNNLLAKHDHVRLHYYTDTEAGSSGAPVLDDEWRVVAIHRKWDEQVPALVFHGEVTPWVNTGTRIDRILEDLQARFSDIAAELTR